MKKRDTEAGSGILAICVLVYREIGAEANPAVVIYCDTFDFTDSEAGWRLSEPPSPRLDRNQLPLLVRSTVTRPLDDGGSIGG
jgi:hypothetical protein